MTVAEEGVLQEFEVRAAFGGDRVVLALVGEVDLLTAPEFAAVLDAVIDRGHRNIVLDLVALKFMDAAGLKVVAQAAKRLGSSAATLTLRSVPPAVMRLLDICHLTEIVAFDQPTPPPKRLTPQSLAFRRSEDGPDPIRVATAGRAGPLRQASAVAAGTDVVDAALRLVVALAEVTVAGADGVSVSLLRHGRLSTVAASDQTIIDMDTDQYATGEGPCVDAAMQGHRFHAESMENETRWSAFTPQARKLGINAILSTPLMAADRPVGALNMYSRTPAVFAVSQQKLAAVFAAQASSILTDAGAGVPDEQLSSRLDKALRIRQIIFQAQGAIMEREHLHEDDAYRLMRSLSKRDDKPFAIVAADVVASTVRPRSVQKAREAGPDD